jgi:hypothetical protein
MDSPAEGDSNPSVPRSRERRAARNQIFSPLRTDSRQLVSKIHWRQSARGSGNIWVDVNRRIIQNYPYGRGSPASELEPSTR